ncbi:unnamed protein product, partial [Arabidopsis halleri]
IYTVCELCNDPHRKTYFYAPSLRVKVTPLNRYASILRFLFCFFLFFCRLAFLPEERISCYLQPQV